MISASDRNLAPRKRMLWAATAMMAVAFVCQGVAMAQGVAPSYPAPSDPQYAAAAAPAAADTPAIAAAPPPVAAPPAVAGFQGQVTQDAINAMVDQRLREIEAAKQQAALQQKQCADEQGYVVGSDMHVTASMTDGLFLWLGTPNKDFTMHIGGWMQWDNVFWDQSPILKNVQKGDAGSAQGVASGANLGG